MRLESDGYAFPVQIIRYDWDPRNVDIVIGNPSCLEISVSMDDPDATLQVLQFFETCNESRKPFVQGSGAMVILVKVALRWLCNTFPHIKTVSLTDKSFFQKQEKRYLLPEKMMLTEGQTWYQKHLQAQPEKKTERILIRYLHVWKEHGNEIKSLSNEYWTPERIKEIGAMYPYIRNFQMTGSAWVIRRSTIVAYDIEDPVYKQGGGRVERSDIDWKLSRNFWV